MNLWHYKRIIGVALGYELRHYRRIIRVALDCEPVALQENYLRWLEL